MKELEIICVVPGDLYFASEVEVLINNFRKFNLSQKLTVLVDYKSEHSKIWEKILITYKEVNIIFFHPSKDIENLRQIYPQVIRPNILKRHFKVHPELENKAIFYIDSDILLTKKLDFTQFLSDEINYLSTTDYISANYFESKKKDVLPFKIKEYENIDVLQKACNIVGIDKQIAINNQLNTGGAQYILKNIDWKFWEKVQNDCVTLRIYLQTINNQYFSSEKIGFQSWCADMWAVLWNLWLNKAETKCPSELDFNWATQPIEKWNECAIYHNAGVSGKYQDINGVKEKMYNKSELIFRENIVTPFDIEEYKNISNKYCSYNYLQEILSIKNPVTKTGKIVY